ncbi:hypothetical protein BD410DRAFT_694255, partial [Rickenella mellea]
QTSGLYRVNHSQPSAASIRVTIPLTELHRRMGHAALDTLRRMVKEGMITGVEIKDNEAETTCAACVKAKLARKPFPERREGPRADSYGKVIHTDLWGAAQTATLSGKKY